VVEPEAQVREGRGDDAAEIVVAALGDNEMEHDILRARSVLEHQEHSRHRAPQVGSVQRHRDVDEILF
jgi:hypothetical protein